MGAVAEAAAFIGASDLDAATGSQMTKAWRIVQRAADISLADLASGIAAEVHIPVADLKQVDPQSAALIPGEVAHRRNVLPLSCTQKNVSVATANPLSKETEREIAALTGRAVDFRVASPSEIATGVLTVYGTAPSSTSRKPDQEPSSRHPTGPHILVVDDDIEQRTLFRSVLEGAGFRVSVAVDGPEAIAMLNSRTDFDLVTLDYWMEPMNGLRVLQHIREKRETARIPVIMLTGSDDRQIEMSLFEAGVDDYLAKPIDAPLFLLRVQAVLRTGVLAGYGPSPSSTSRKPDQEPSSRHPTGPHILVVDDDIEQRTLFRSVLEGAGFRVSVAVDGPEAIAMLNSRTDFDLVTLDYWMEPMNGLRVLQHIREKRETARIPVIMLTGSDDRQIEMSLFEAGVDDYLAKPIDAPLFLLRVQAVFRRKQFA